MAKYSRRDFNRGLLLLGLGTASGALLSAVPALAQEAKPKRGGTFSGTFISEPASLDPVRGNQPGSDGRSYNLFSEKLLTLDADSVFQPWLADSWEYSEDGLNLTFKLKSGIKFQDGTDFDAAAVKFNLDRSRDPIPESRTANYLSKLASVEVIDPLTVKLTLTAISPAFLASLASEPGQMVSPAAVEALGVDFGRSPVGTGPFKITSWTGGRIQAERWDGYWQKDADGEQLPYLDGIDINIVPSPAVQLVQLRSGATVWADSLLTQDYAAVDADPALELVKQPYQTTMASSFNNSAAPFKDNLNLRKAVAHAINREALAKIIVGDYGGPAVCVEAPSSWASSPDLKGPAYDPDLARQAFADSGHTGPILLSIIQRDPDSQVAQIIQAMLKEVGIDLQIEVLERTAWVEKVNSGDFQMTLQGMSTPSPDATAAQYYVRTAQINYPKISDEVIFGLVDEALSELDQDKRKALYIKMQQQILDNYYQMFLYWSQRYAARNVSVKGMVLERVNSFILTKAWIDA